MEKILFLIFLPAFSFASGDAEWTDCKVDGDCIKVMGACSNPQAINRKFRLDFEKATAKAMQNIDCAGVPDPENSNEIYQKYLAEESRKKSLVSKCIKAKCQLILPSEN